MADIEKAIDMVDKNSSVTNSHEQHGLSIQFLWIEGCLCLEPYKSRVSFLFPYPISTCGFPLQFPFPLASDAVS